jgi:glycosyltransferase involved in cell wall biosynthesis
MNILVVSNMGAKPSAPLLGGFVDQQVKALKGNNYHVSYYKMLWNGDSTLHKIFKYPVFFLQFIFLHILSRNKVDIIHVHYYFPTILCAALYKIFRNTQVKIIVTCHGGDIYCYQPPSWYYRKLSHIVDHWLFTSQQLKERFYRQVTHADIVSAGYDDSVFNISENETAKIFDCLLVGNLDKNKGMDRFMSLVIAMPEVKFAVAGAGSYQLQLDRCALENTNLTLLGVIQPKVLADKIRQSKCLLSLSRNESFGLVIAEANACGTPCIATITDGSNEQLTNWPYTVEQHHIQEIDITNQLQDNIAALLSLSDTAYQQLQQQAQSRAVNYSLSNVILTIEKQYKKLYLSNQNECNHV